MKIKKKLQKPELKKSNKVKGNLYTPCRKHRRQDKSNSQETINHKY